MFWRPDAKNRNGIARSGRVQDVADGLSEYPHVIVNQARMQDFLLGHMRTSPSRLEPDYGLEAVGIEVEPTGEYPVRATLRRTGTGTGTGTGTESGELEIRVKYVVGADGARSTVRASMGVKMLGDARNHAGASWTSWPSPTSPTSG